MDASKMAEKVLPTAVDFTRSAQATKRAFDRVDNLWGQFNSDVQSVISVIKSTKPDIAAKYSDEINRVLSQLQEAQKVMRSDPVKARTIIEAQMPFINSIPSIPGLGSIQSAKNSLLTIHHTLGELTDVYGLASKNIGKPAPFINEYLRLRSSYPDEAARWLTNPQNAKFFDELMKSGRARKIINELKQSGAESVPWATRLKGITYTDVLKRIGLGTAGAAGAGALGVSKVFSWLDSSTDDITAQTDGIENTLSSLQRNTSGTGRDIVAAVNKAMANLNTASKRATQMMSENMPDAVSNFTKDIVSQHAVLAGALNQWDRVIDSSSDPRLAEQARSQLGAFVGFIENQIKQLGANVGVQIRTPQDEFSRAGNISQIQDLLNLPVTGELDQATINALKSLENKLNSEAGSNEFAGYFYNPALNHVISYQDLLNAKRRLEKY